MKERKRGLFDIPCILNDDAVFSALDHNVYYIVFCNKLWWMRFLLP